MTIAVDIDGVLADYVTAYSKLLIRLHPPLKQEFFLDSTEFPDRWFWFDMAPTWAVKQANTEVQNSGNFWRRLFPYFTAYADLKALDAARFNDDIYFVTTREGKSAKAETEEWLAANGFIGNPSVIIAYDKPQLCQAMKIDMIIDDKPENLIGYVTGTERYLFKRPYNKGWWDRMKTVNTVREALDDFKRLGGQSHVV